MHSETIIKTPVVFFLGAGASRPLGKPLMGEFIDMLEKDKGFRDRKLFAEIVKSERDLEFLFEELDDWIGKEYYAPTDVFRSSPAYGLLGTTALDREAREFEAGFQQILGEAHRLRSDLKREVFRAYRGLHNSQAVIGLFEPLFAMVALAPGLQPFPLVVFTTNYDPAMEKFCELSASKYILHDGFVHREDLKAYMWARSAFDNFEPSKSRKDLVLFKIHGSTSWTKTSDGIIRSPATVFIEDDTAHDNVLIYPAKKKVALDDPFFTGYDYFHRCMDTCSLCIVIGYSFRDYDALTRLMSASRLNGRLKLLVLDPRADEVCSLLRRHGIDAEPLAFRLSMGKESSDYLLLIKSALSMS
jgi:SIR2-like protein